MDPSRSIPQFLRLSPGEKGLRTDRPLRKLAVASVLTVVATALLVSGVVLWSASRSDQVTQERQVRIVASALTRSLEQIPYDQESVAIWDDSIRHVRDGLDLAWIESNLGVWMHTYFKHDRVYLVDAKDTARYAMADGGTVAVPEGVPDAPTRALIAELRQKIAAGALAGFEKGAARIPRAADFTFTEGRPAIVSVMPLVSDTGQISQERGTEWLIASVRFLDGSFLSDLAHTYVLAGVRFSRTGDIASNESALPLVNRSGVTIGNLVWVPKLPGWTILSDVLPVIAGGLAAIGAAVLFLIRGLSGTYRELVRSEACSKHRALHDALTGLPNRAYFNEHLGTALAHPHEDGRLFALMFLDLDRFKHVNDTLGHPVGDELIREVASRLNALIAPGDLLARMGGDEFAVVKCGVRGLAEVEAFCRAAIAAVTRPFDVLGHQAAVGISIGVALAPEAGTDRSELARQADIALYQAKNSGGQRFQLFTEEMGKVLQERRQLEGELRRALDGTGELEVVYQPLLSARTLDISGVEALVRWNHRRLGNVPPRVFISIAEECGLIDRLGDWVLRETCRAARGWDVPMVAVNVSPLQVRHLDFADRVLAILSESGMEPDRLEIEITENTLLDSSETPGRVLQSLREAGVRVALDDFGTGYSSLSYLIRLEVDRIKVDCSFVQNLGRCPRASSIVQAIVTMAHAVGMSVTAEGVETREQQDFLTLIDCDTLQGFFFSRPLPAHILSERLKAGSDALRQPADPQAAA